MAWVVPLGVGNCAEHAAQLVVAIQHERDRLAIGRRNFLFNMRDLQFRRHFDLAAVGREFTANRREQTGLA
jgi:hypothetical protein